MKMVANMVMAGKTRSRSTTFAMSNVSIEYLLLSLLPFDTSPRVCVSSVEDQPVCLRFGCSDANPWRSVSNGTHSGGLQSYKTGLHLNASVSAVCRPRFSTEMSLVLDIA